MPVNLDFGNSLMSAYAQGRAELEREINRQKDDEERIKEDEFRQKQFDEQKRQHEQSIKQSDEHFKANAQLQKAMQDLQKIEAGIKFQEHAEKTGIAPPGFKMDSLRTIGAPVKEVAPGEFIPSYYSYEDPVSGIKFDARLPQGVAADEAAQDRITDAAKIDYLKKATDVTATSNRETARIDRDADFENRKILLDIEDKKQTAREQRQYTQAKELFKLKSDSAEAIAGTKAAGKTKLEYWSRFPVDPEIRKFFPDHPDAQTLGELFPGGEMDAPGKKLFLDYTNAEDSIEKVLPKLEAKYTLANGKEISGYDLFFKGALKGKLEERIQGLPSYAVKEVEAMRKELGKIFLSMKELEGLGAVLSENEQALLGTYVATPTRDITSTRAQAIFSDLLPTIQQRRANTAMVHVKGSSNSVDDYKVLPE